MRTAAKNCAPDAEAEAEAEAGYDDTAKDLLLKIKTIPRMTQVL